MAQVSAPQTEVAIALDKIRRCGVIGAGVVQDSLTVLRLSQARKARASQQAPMPVPSAGPPTALAPAEPPKPKVMGPATVAKPDGSLLTRDQILAILAETVRVQAVVQQEVSQLARKLAKEKGEKKKRKPLSFLEGHKKIQELALPKEPLDDHGLTEPAFQKILMSYEEDEEVMTCAQRLLHPVGKGDPERARGINMEKIVEIHRFMVQEMEKVLKEFLELPQETRRTFTSKGCETTAELLVSYAVEQSLAVRCEDVEQAVIMYEEPLTRDADFQRYTEQLANMMQHLVGAAQPRVQKADFVKILQAMGDSTKKAKIFGKKLYEDYRSKACTIAEAYQRFSDFSDEASAAVNDGEELPDLGAVELQLCYDEYRSDEEVRRAWDHSGVENNLMMQQSFSPLGAGGARSAGSSPSEEKKGKKLKVSEIVEMQELMVDEMKRTTEQAMVALRDGGASAPAWKAEITIQMVQALASAAVERRYGVSAEEMSLAGVQLSAHLQQNERFARASSKQQEILMMLARIRGKDA